MHQLLLPEIPEGSKDWILEGREYHHLVRVLRRREGDSIPVLDTGGRRYTAVIAQIRSGSCVLSLSQADPETDRDIRLCLYQCVPKGKTMETIIRQTIEAGVSSITPVVSRYTVPVLTGADQEKKIRRWQTLADAAAEQSACTVPPRINSIIRLEEIISIPADEESGIGLVFHEKKAGGKSLHRLLAGPVRTVFLVIGPEGGLSGKELETLMQKGYNTVHLGSGILRTDSASLFAVAAVKTILLEKNSWSVQS